MITEYNKRQLKMMFDRLNWYEQGEISLGKLVNDLEALLGVLEDKDEGLEEKFLSYWGVLEDDYSFMLYEKRKTLDEEDTKDVNNAVTKLKTLVRSYLDKFPQEEA